jgi:membrane fusion protein, multidrug efflux system
VKKQYLVAIGIAVLILVWMFAPRGERSIEDRYAAEPANREVLIGADTGTGNTADFTVRAARLNADIFTEMVRVRGRTQAFRHVNIRSETAGRITATPVARGARVNAGDILCEIAIDNREADLQEALSRREQARFEYEGAVDLQRRSLTSQVSVAQLKASYDAAVAAVGRAELALQRTRITAPFSGIMESRAVEVGDYIDMGGQCASLFDDQPMLLIGQVPEQDVGKLSIGSAVFGQMVTGDMVQGRLTYIARAADNVSRSYRIEVELEPSGKSIRQGVSTEILINASEIRAQLLPPSAMTLDDEGLIGVKTLNQSNEVEFRHVTIVGESTRIDRPGFWVTGLPESVVLITHGQELVFPGQSVRTNFDWSQL